MTLLDSPPRSAQTFARSEELLPTSRLSETAAAEVHSSVLDPCTDKTWDEAVAAHPQASPFHTSAWAKVLSETYGHRAFYLRFTDNNGGTAALLPLLEVNSAITGRRGVCLPFSDHCEPLLFDSQITSESLLNDVSALANERSWKFVEFRGRPLAASSSTPAYESYHGHWLDLTPSVDALFENCSSAFRRGLRKAERSGLRVEVRTDAEAVRRFYDLHARTRRRHGVPPQPFSFFQSILRQILSRRAGFMVLASERGTPVAAAMFFHFQTNGIFKFGASDHRHQEFRGSNLVMWEGIRECAARGVKTLHFGRTDLPQEGLRRFKLALGVQEETLRYYRYAIPERRWLARPSSSGFSAHTAVLRRLPLTINRLAGTMVYPHLH